MRLSFRNDLPKSERSGEYSLRTTAKHHPKTASMNPDKTQSGYALLWKIIMKFDGSEEMIVLGEDLLCWKERPEFLSRCPSLRYRTIFITPSYRFQEIFTPRLHISYSDSLNSFELSYAAFSSKWLAFRAIGPKDLVLSKHMSKLYLQAQTVGNSAVILHFSF